MGKGFENYMSKKWFHPTNVENQKRKYLAEQKHASDLKRQQELRDQYEREQEIFSNKQLMGDEKARLGLAFMYNAPGSLKDQEKKEEENQQNEKFEWQKNAPREQWAKNNESIQDKPFGVEVKNVRCIKCKRWGHVNTDKSCPMYGKSRLDVDSDTLPPMDTDKLVENMRSQGLELKQSALSMVSSKDIILESNVTNKENDENEEITLEMLRALPKKEKKILLKRLLRLDKKRRKKESSKN